MPTEVDGVPMTIEPASDSAQSFLILWNDEQTARDLLQILGKTEADVDIVFSYSTPDVPQITLNAYRVIGADAEALKDGMAANYLAVVQSSGGVVTETTLGGKNVTVLSLANSPPGVGEHFYAVGDIVFNVSADPPEWVAKTLAVLP